MPRSTAMSRPPRPREVADQAHMWIRRISQAAIIPNAAQMPCDVSAARETTPAPARRAGRPAGRPRWRRFPRSARPGSSRGSGSRIRRSARATRRTRRSAPSRPRSSSLKTTVVRSSPLRSSPSASTTSPLSTSCARPDMPVEIRARLGLVRRLAERPARRGRRRCRRRSRSRPGADGARPCGRAFSTTSTSGSPPSAPRPRARRPRTRSPACRGSPAAAETRMRA